MFSLCFLQNNYFTGEIQLLLIFLNIIIQCRPINTIIKGKHYIEGKLHGKVGCNHSCKFKCSIMVMLVLLGNYFSSGGFTDYGDEGMWCTCTFCIVHTAQLY